ncbi:hypothetical protein HNP02_007659 [Mycobacterium sp. AZCC_0083]|nr:hypothetical protein [Mycobacterium sp. AZCC_0083]
MTEFSSTGPWGLAAESIASECGIPRQKIKGVEAMEHVAAGGRRARQTAGRAPPGLRQPTYPKTPTNARKKGDDVFNNDKS